MVLSVLLILPKHEHHQQNSCRHDATKQAAPVEAFKTTEAEASTTNTTETETGQEDGTATNF